VRFFKHLRVALLMLAFHLGLVQSSWALLHITPSISLREEYNDNIFLTPTDKEGDFITSIFPSINVSSETDFLKLSLDYGLDIKLYLHNSDQNETSLKGMQRINLDTTLSPYKDIFFIKISDVYERVSIDERDQVAYDNYIVNMTDRNIFSINPYVEYPLSGTVKTRLGYTYKNVWYSDDAGDNYEDHMASLSITKELSAKLTGTVSYDYLMYKPTKNEDHFNEDYDQQTARLQLHYALGPNFTIEGGIGQTWFDYERQEDSDFFVWNVLAQYNVTKNISISGGYAIEFPHSVEEGTYESKVATGTLNYAGKIPLNVTVFKKDDTYLSSDREDKATGVTLGTTIPITPKVACRLNGLYTKYEFFDPDEKTDRYGFQIAFDYQLKRTFFSLGYTYNQNDSNIDDNDYKNNIVWAQIRLAI
jgi:hypothetical protein